MTDLTKTNNSNNALAEYGHIQTEIINLLETSRRVVARNINSIMTATYWEIGRRIVQLEQGGESRAGYGEILMKRLAVDLTQRFGRGFSRQNLQQMRNFYLALPLESICQTVSGKFEFHDIFQEDGNVINLIKLAQFFPLPWSAYVCLLPVKNPEARSFYETEALRCGWSVRQLARQINSQFYERIALSKNKTAMLEKARQVDLEDLISPTQMQDRCICI